MMTIEEAKSHALEVANSKCDACGLEHRQLAEWLQELINNRSLLRLFASRYLVDHLHYSYMLYKDENRPVGHIDRCKTCLAYRLFCSTLQDSNRVQMNYPDDISKCITYVIKAMDIMDHEFMNSEESYE